MVTKSERFEMRLDSEVLNRVDLWRAQQADVPTRSEAVRRLLEIGMDNSEKGKIRFNPAEKLMLGMIGDIHRHLGIEKGWAKPDFVMDSITGGHSWALDWEYGVVFNNYEDKPRDVTFVVDVLDMWSFIEESLEGISDAEKELLQKEVQGSVTFLGFDGNKESELVSIARFLIDVMDRFERFSGRRLNSHCPVRSRYEAMLLTFEKIRPSLIGIKLSRNQVIDILSQRGFID